MQHPDHIPETPQIKLVNKDMILVGGGFDDPEVNVLVCSGGFKPNLPVSSFTKLARVLSEKFGQAHDATHFCRDPSRNPKERDLSDFVDVVRRHPDQSVREAGEHILSVFNEAKTHGWNAKLMMVQEHDPTSDSSRPHPDGADQEDGRWLYTLSEHGTGGFLNEDILNMDAVMEENRVPYIRPGVEPFHFQFGDAFRFLGTSRMDRWPYNAYHKPAFVHVPPERSEAELLMTFDRD